MKNNFQKKNKSMVKKMVEKSFRSLYHQFCFVSILKIKTPLIFFHTYIEQKLNHILVTSLNSPQKVF